MTAHYARGTARVYEGHHGLTTWPGADITVEWDGSTLYIDACDPGAAEEDFPLGRPGIGIQLDEDEADEFLAAILAAIGREEIAT